MFGKTSSRNIRPLLQQSTRLVLTVVFGVLLDVRQLFADGLRPLATYSCSFSWDDANVIPDGDGRGELGTYKSVGTIFTRSSSRPSSPYNEESGISIAPMRFTVNGLALDAFVAVNTAASRRPWDPIRICRISLGISDSSGRLLGSFSFGQNIPGESYCKNLSIDANNQFNVGPFLTILPNGDDLTLNCNMVLRSIFRHAHRRGSR